MGRGPQTIEALTDCQQASSSEQQQGKVIISMGRGPETIEALTGCQQAGSSNGWGS
ncbi:hypothetical protein P692DRAFT_20883186 [Suillus brevipes Sb2]|nr:hypothetical protein P692DRAFT_20883186 [Suillus brevipes Sb2]